MTKDDFLTEIIEAKKKLDRSVEEVYDKLFELCKADKGKHYLVMHLYYKNQIPHPPPTHVVYFSNQIERNQILRGTKIEHIEIKPFEWIDQNS